MVPFSFITGAGAAALGVAAIWMAWRKTKGRPLLRLVAMVGAVAFALVLNTVVREINRDVAGRVLRSAGLQRPFPQVMVGTTPIRLTSPEGQCQLSDRNESEASLVNKLRGLFAGKNQLLAVFADCGELEQFRSRTLSQFDNYAQLVTPTSAMKARVPADFLKEFCAAMRTKTDQDLAAIAESRKPDIERAFKNAKLDEPKLLGVLDEVPTVCYTGQLARLTTESGVEKTQIGIIATAVIKGKLIAYQLYAPLNTNDTISDLLRKHKSNVAALIAANGD